MKYDTFIFDLDGTLLDTLGDLAASVNYALRQHGMPERSTDDIRRFVGNGVRLLMERAVPQGSATTPGDSSPGTTAVFESFRQHYMRHALDTTRPYDGVEELLFELRRRGCRLAVVSNKMMAVTQELVRHFFPEIEVAIGEHEAEGIRKKPAPDTVFEALRQLQLLPASHRRGASSGPVSHMPGGTPVGGLSSAVYVGDSEVDLQTARNSGLPCVSVLWGFRDREFLEAHGATTFVTAPQQILQLNL